MPAASWQSTLSPIFKDFSTVGLFFYGLFTFRSWGQLQLFWVWRLRLVVAATVCNNFSANLFVSFPVVNLVHPGWNSPHGEPLNLFLLTSLFNFYSKFFSWNQNFYFDTFANFRRTVTPAMPDVPRPKITKFSPKKHFRHWFYFFWMENLARASQGIFQWLSVFS